LLALLATLLSRDGPREDGKHGETPPRHSIKKEIEQVLCAKPLATRAKKDSHFLKCPARPADNRRFGKAESRKLKAENVGRGFETI